MAQFLYYSFMKLNITYANKKVKHKGELGKKARMYSIFERNWNIFRQYIACHLYVTHSTVWAIFHLYTFWGIVKCFEWWWFGYSLVCLATEKFVSMTIWYNFEKRKKGQLTFSSLKMGIKCSAIFNKVPQTGLQVPPTVPYTLCCI